MLPFMNTSTFFDSLYKNAKQNAIIIMNTDGIITEVNQAFTSNFGYEKDELKNKNFTLLFTEKDRNINKPERELATVKTFGSCNDDNYLLHKDGNKIWVSGESILVNDGNDGNCVIKVIHNIHAKKQLERFLLESNDFIESIFDSVNEIGLMILSSQLKVIKVNKAFVSFFDLAALPQEKCRLSEIDHTFWKKDEIRKAITDVIVKGEVVKNKIFDLQNDGSPKSIDLSIKLIDGNTTVEKNILIVVKAA